jgi:plastocyanin
MAMIDLTAPAVRRAVLCKGAALVSVALVGQRANAAGADVAIDNFAFAPTALTVARGTTVTWKNRDDIPHAISCPALNVQSQVLEANDTFDHSFSQAGAFDYFCSIHPHMRGHIIVSG